jgi:hypothetical protein
LPASAASLSDAGASAPESTAVTDESSGEDDESADPRTPESCPAAPESETAMTPPSVCAVGVGAGPLESGAPLSGAWLDPSPRFCVWLQPARRVSDVAVAAVAKRDGAAKRRRRIRRKREEFMRG